MPIAVVDRKIAEPSLISSKISRARPAPDQNAVAMQQPDADEARHQRNRALDGDDQGCIIRRMDEKDDQHERQDSTADLDRRKGLHPLQPLQQPVGEQGGAGDDHKTPGVEGGGIGKEGNGLDQHEKQGAHDAGQNHLTRDGRDRDARHFMRVVADRRDLARRAPGETPGHDEAEEAENHLRQRDMAPVRHAQNARRIGRDRQGQHIGGDLKKAERGDIADQARARMTARRRNRLRRRVGRFATQEVQAGHTKSPHHSVGSAKSVERRLAALHEKPAMKVTMH